MEKEIKDFLNWTPLMLACTKADVAIVKCLIESGADVHLKNKDGWSCFHIACREGSPEIVDFLLNHEGSLWDVTSKNGRTPLHTAALHGHSGVVSLLLDRGGYGVDVRDSCGTTPLMDAIRAGYTDTAQTLLEHQADVYTEDAVGRSALHLAAQAGSHVSIRWLVQEHGVPVNVKSSVSGITALHLAAKEGQHQTLTLLCSLGADSNTTDNKGRTALHQACGGQFVDCVRVLYDNGAIDCPDEGGQTARSLVRTPELSHLMDTWPS